MRDKQRIWKRKKDGKRRENSPELEALSPVLGHNYPVVKFTWEPRFAILHHTLPALWWGLGEEAANWPPELAQQSG